MTSRMNYLHDCMDSCKANTMHSGTLILQLYLILKLKYFAVICFKIATTLHQASVLISSTYSWKLVAEQLPAIKQPQLPPPETMGTDTQANIAQSNSSVLIYIIWALRNTERLCLLQCRLHGPWSSKATYPKYFTSLGTVMINTISVPLWLVILVFINPFYWTLH